MEGTFKVGYTVAFLVFLAFTLLLLFLTIQFKTEHDRTCILVKNLPASANEGDLRALFAEKAEVSRVSWVFVYEGIIRHI